MARRHDTAKAKRPCVLSEQEAKLQPHSPFMSTAEYRKISDCAGRHYVGILLWGGVPERWVIWLMGILELFNGAMM